MDTTESGQNQNVVTKKRIMLTGASGVGKTTLSNHLSEILGLKFISGSYSDLVPETRDETHTSMIQKDTETIRNQDYRLVGMRHNAVKNEDAFIMDRSHFDSIAYWVNKLSHRVPACDTTDFFNYCMELLFADCTHMIYIPYTKRWLKEWVIEDNGKRIISGWYQYQMSGIMNQVLELIPDKVIDYKDDDHVQYRLFHKGKTIRLMILTDVFDHNRRIELSTQFLQK